MTDPSLPPLPPPGPPPFPTTPPRWELSQALGWAWSTFSARWQQFTLAGALVLVPMVVLYTVFIGAFLSVALTSDCAARDAAGQCTDVEPDGGHVVIALGATGLAFVLFFFLTQLVTAGFLRAALGATEGRPFRARDVFRLHRPGAVLATAAMIAVATLAGTLLCYLPGLVVSLFTAFSMCFLVDQGLSPVASIKASVALVRANLGSALLWVLVGTIIAGAGGSACLIGVVVTYPLFFLGTAYTYKRLTDQQVAA